MTLGVPATSDLSEHVRKNLAKWDNLAEQYVATGERGWARDTLAWRIWLDGLYPTAGLLELETPFFKTTRWS